MIALIFLFCSLCLVAGYFLYGKRIERNIVRDIEKQMPSDEMCDGVDYIPTPTPVLFGHHFSSIAGAGPIVGPIIAAIAFGWFPVLLWILIGAIFIGAVHDYTAAVASVNHRGMSIGELCRKYFSRSVYYMMLVFVWLALSYVIIVFLDLTAGTMSPSSVVSSPPSPFCEYGSVATASIIYIVLAVLFGVSVNNLKIGFRRASFIFVPLVFVGLFIGYKFPLRGEYITEIFGSVKNFWTVVLLGYCFLASILPVWVLLQPRDYLSSFLLYMSLIVSAIGLLITGFSGEVGILYPSFIGFNDPELGFIFPALFITVACGAVSGFHSLVSAGTTAKQLNRKRSILPVVFGSMLVEGVLAVLAVVAVMMMARPVAGTAVPKPTVIFANALGKFAESCGMSHEIGLIFGLLAISTFLLTTLDTCTRLTRFILEEIIQKPFPAKRYITTFASLIFPAFICFLKIDNKPAWLTIWPAFGTTNQLLAAITLLVVTVWLFRDKRKVRYTIVPMIFMFVTASVSLVMLTVQRLGKNDYIIGVISLVMVMMSVCLIVDATASFLKKRPEKAKTDANR